MINGTIYTEKNTNSQKQNVVKILFEPIDTESVCIHHFRYQQVSNN